MNDTHSPEYRKEEVYDSFNLFVGVLSTMSISTKPRKKPSKKSDNSY